MSVTRILTSLVYFNKRFIFVEVTLVYLHTCMCVRESARVREGAKYATFDQGDNKL